MCVPTFDIKQQQLMAEAVNLTQQIDRIEAGPRQSRLRDRLAHLQQQLAAFTQPLTTQTLTACSIPAAVRQCFVQAVQLLPLYRQLGCAPGLFGTWRSPTLENYHIALTPSHWQTKGFSNQLMKKFGLTANAQNTINQTIQTKQQAIQKHQLVITTLLDRFNQLTHPTDNLALLNALIGNLPIPANALATVATKTQIIFLLDYEGDRLRDLGQWNSLEPPAQATIQTFLQAVTEFQFSQFANFPTFGKFNATNLQPAICQELADSTGISLLQVIRILQQAIGLVPLSQAETFLIHDICGHGWQQLLTQFGGNYAILALADEAINPGLAAYTPEGPITLREVFSLTADSPKRKDAPSELDRINQAAIHQPPANFPADNDSASSRTTVNLDDEMARLFFHGEVKQRFTSLITHLIAEMLADFHEFKWVCRQPEHRSQLPSSSAFPNLPAKLDLGILDLAFLSERLLHPLLDFSISPHTDSSLEQSLLDEWKQFDPTTRSQLKRSLLQLHQIFWEEYLLHYQPQTTEPRDRFGQILSNLIYLQNTCNQLLCSNWAPSNPAFQDILALFIGCYCSEDTDDRFWQLDEVLADYFIPCWQLLQSINAPSSTSAPTSNTKAQLSAVCSTEC